MSLHQQRNRNVPTIRVKPFKLAADCIIMSPRPEDDADDAALHHPNAQYQLPGNCITLIWQSRSSKVLINKHI
eukprot:scaffold241910_cov18-Prasinocladus_malaysianus.AAC.1